MKFQSFLFIFLVAFGSLHARAQAPPIEWQKSYGGSNLDAAMSMDVTGDCGFIIAGYTFSSDGDVTGQHGKKDFWLCKLNHDGSLAWQKTYGGTGDDMAYSVKQTRDGGFIAVGFTISNNGDVIGYHTGVQLSSATPDLWVIKTDASGQLQWQKSLGGKGREIGYAVELTPDGGYIITGEANENDGDVSGYHTGTLLPNTPDLWVVKLSSTGSLEWQKCYGSYFNELGNAIRPTSDGGYIVTGYAQVSSPDTGDVKGIHNPPSGGVRADAWVLKLSSHGGIEWQRCLGGAQDDIGYDVIESKFGGYTILAITVSNDGDVIGGNGIYNQVWLVKLSAAGKIERQYARNVPYTLHPRNLTEDFNGDLTIGAVRYFSIGTQEYDDFGGADYLLMKTDSLGALKWEKRVGGPGHDLCSMVLPTMDNGYILCGGAPLNGFDVTGNHGMDDFWVVKLGPLATISISASSENVCTGVPVVFSATVANAFGNPHYQWLLNGNKIGHDSSQLTLQDLQNNDTISCILSTPTNCATKLDTSNTIIMKVVTGTAPVIAITANTNSICSGGSIQFDASIKNAGNNPIYQWSVNGVSVGSNNPDFSSTTLKDNDIVNCTLIANGDCGPAQSVVSNNIQVNVKPLVQTAVAITANQDTICKGGQVVFHATTVNTGVNAAYQWQLNGQNINANASDLTLSDLNPGDQVQLLVQTDTTCATPANPFSNIVAIQFKAVAPPVNLGPDKRVCVGVPVTLQAGNTYNSYTWQNGSTANSITGTSAGLYWINVEDACGNISKDSVIIEYFPRVQNLLPADTALCVYESIELKPSLSLLVYQWSNSAQSPTITINKPGLYWLSGKDLNGCNVADSIQIDVKDCIKGFYVPSAFTPNHDAKNDRFKPLLFGEVEKYEFRIFNRFGEVIFASRKVGEGWDGKFKGIDQPSNSYVWQCIYQFKNEAIRYKKGTFILMR